jgi:hypothetical protein
VSDLSHLWQRFVLASALVFGLLLGVGATVFGYSNTAPVNVGWSIFHLNAIPLWTVALVPLAMVLLVGTLYHWFNSLHHFTEHMRHRRRVHELEAEVASLRKHIDDLLQLPDGSAPKVVPASEPQPPAQPALPEPVASNGEDRMAKKTRKRVSLTTESEPEAVAVTTDGSPETPEPPAADS